MLEALGLPIPTPLRASYTLDEFIEDFARPGGAIRMVKVHKRRTRYMVGGCTAELSEVVANGKPTRTIAVESTDAEGVIRAVRELGLSGYTNTSYPRALAALIDDEPERYAVIDAGTNSIKFHIGERDVGGKWRTVVDRAEMTRLGEGLAQQGVIIDAALERTATAIAAMVDEAKRHGVRAIAAVGTAGLRIASNGSQVVAAIEARTGIHIDVISGEEEGRLAYVAAKAGLGLNKGSLVVFDTGGGSSQVHLRARRQRGRAFQRRCRCRALHRALRTGPRRVARGAGRSHGGDFGRPGAPRRPPGARCAGRDGRRGDQYHRGQPSSRHL